MRWAPPTPRRLEILAENLREQDRIEVMASDGLDAWEAVHSSWRASQVCECIDGDDGEVVGVCGVSGETIWLLGAAGLTSTASHRRQLLQGGRVWVGEMLAAQPSPGPARLCNWAYAANVESVRWLRFLGFTVYHPTPHGIHGEPFCFFEKVRL